MLHKDLCVDIVRVHKLVSLYIAQPRLAQLMRNMDLSAMPVLTMRTSPK
jgi:hypothetical protein